MQKLYVANSNLNKQQQSFLDRKLMRCVLAQNVDGVRKCLISGANPNYVPTIPPDNNSFIKNAYPLIHAQFSGNFPIFKLLIDSGANVQPKVKLDSDANPFTDLFIRFNRKMNDYVLDNCRFKLNPVLFAKILFRANVREIEKIVKKSSQSKMIKLTDEIKNNTLEIVLDAGLLDHGTGNMPDLVEKINLVGVFLEQNKLNKTIKKSNIINKSPIKI